MRRDRATRTSRPRGRSARPRRGRRRWRDIRTRRRSACRRPGWSRRPRRRSPCRSTGPWAPRSRWSCGRSGPTQEAVLRPDVPVEFVGDRHRGPDDVPAFVGDAAGDDRKVAVRGDLAFGVVERNGGELHVSAGEDAGGAGVGGDVFGRRRRVRLDAVDAVAGIAGGNWEACKSLALTVVDAIENSVRRLVMVSASIARSDPASIRPELLRSPPGRLTGEARDAQPRPGDDVGRGVTEGSVEPEVGRRSGIEKAGVREVAGKGDGDAASFDPPAPHCRTTPRPGAGRRRRRGSRSRN